ncbi:MAG: LLM class flavin-dependent oxidoreductase [Alphaproteobacteria bacterium]
MQYGLMMRGQFAAEDDIVVRFQELCAQARLAERVGFSSLCKGSHYAGAPSQDFQQLPFLSRMMAEVPSMRLLAGLVLLPLHKPLDLAEQLATIDVMSGGRLIFGCGLGYRELEFRAFGTTQSERVKRFEENLEAIKRLWTGEPVSMKASHFELMEATTSLRPAQRPRPPIWIGAMADAAVLRAARLGDCWYIPPQSHMDQVHRQYDLYRTELDKLGRPFPSEFPMRRECFVARTREEAVRLCGEALAAKFRTYHDWGGSRTLAQGDTLDHAFDELIKGRFLIGTPEQVAEEIATTILPLGVNHLVLSMQWAGMETQVSNDAVQLFAEEAMPLVAKAR